MLQFLKLNRVLLFFILATPWTINYFYKFADFDNYIILAVLGFVMLFIWFGLLNQELMKRIPKRVEITDTLFYINLFLMFLLISLFYILSKPNLTYHFTGIAALPFLYLIYAVFQIYNHLSKLLTFVEQEREVEFSKRVGEMILFFFYFIGIWWLQPRIINALEKPEVVHEKYVSFREREANEQNTGEEPKKN